MNNFLKRLTDLLGSSIGLILLSPLFLLFSLMIRLGSKGPALFRQTRVGRNGNPFKILKFRTMVDSAENKGPQLTTDNDPRVTRVGRVLRKTKLDELPQLINVWLGQMSLVGPRPEVPHYVKQYSDEQKQILRYKPGITDPASIEFRNESELLGSSGDSEKLYVEQIMPAKIRKNLDYQAKATWLKDIGVILKTIGVMFRK